MTRVRRLIVAGSRDIVHVAGEDGGHYDAVRDAIWAWEREHGIFDRIASGTNGYTEVPDRYRRNTPWRLYGQLPRDSNQIRRIVGADLLGEWYARAHAVPVDRYPYLREFGKAGGPMRNAQMVADACGLVVVRYPDSRGSRDVLEQATAKGLPIVDVLLERPAARSA